MLLLPSLAADVVLVDVVCVGEGGGGGVGVEEEVN